MIKYIGKFRLTNDCLDFAMIIIIAHKICFKSNRSNSSHMAQPETVIVINYIVYLGPNERSYLT